MIKRIIACLTICLIITGLISPVFSHAEPIPIYTPNWNDPGISEIINISDLTGWMANGGVFDITDFQDLEEFLTWYYKIRVPMQDENGEIYFAPYYGYDNSLSSGDLSGLKFSQQSNIRGMISRSYQNKVGYGRRLQEQVDKALIEDGSLSNVNVPLLDLAEAAFFVGYNPYAIKDYRNYFYDDSDPAPIPQPNQDYLSYLNNINTTGFWWRDYPNNLTNNYDSLCIFPCNLSTWTCDLSHSLPLTRNDVYQLFGIPIQDLFITYSNGIYSFDHTINFDNNQGSFYTRTNDHTQTYWGGLYVSPVEFFGSAGNNNQTIRYQYSNSNLGSVFEFIQSKFRNVNIYVNGNCWAYVGGNTNPVIPEFPDVIGGEDLPATTWPLTVPKAPSYINLPGLRQAFQRAKNTDNQFDIMDLKDSLVDPEGDPITDPELETVPIPLPNPDPINPEVIPELPSLPLIPPANNPGFTGVSVLAEIINFTNQSLPSAIIVVFWGIVFGAVILGLIKILHK